MTVAAHAEIMAQIERIMNNAGYFSDKQMHGMNTSQIQNMLMTAKGVNWNDLPVWQRRGSCGGRCGWARSQR